jgi:hypothetical protein
LVPVKGALEIHLDLRRPGHCLDIFYPITSWRFWCPTTLGARLQLAKGFYYVMFDRGFFLLDHQKADGPLHQRHFQASANQSRSLKRSRR